MNLVLFGPPGSGKGTQAELLRDRLGFVHYSTGEVFRDHISRKTPVGVAVEQYVVSGGLVPDETVMAVVSAFLTDHAGRSIVFDGFPRTIPQAAGLDKVLAERSAAVDVAVLVDLSDDEAVRRLTSRRQCRRCAKIYNLSFSPPREAGKCDDCGGELYQRRDDSEAVIRDRLGVYHSQTRPLIEFYEAQARLTRIDGALGRDRVFEVLSELVDGLKGR
ncbi:adenylate kinase [candidate division WOR-3 bacterium]|nr:adenylate kinase [candidate division WOR-3 bacterium]